VASELISTIGDLEELLGQFIYLLVLRLETTDVGCEGILLWLL
jgi:hypothetical protein